MATTDMVRSMIAYWKSFDLQKLQEELDKTASMLTVQCEETDLSRQLLLQKSREFKRNSSEDVQKMIAPLLKSFQSEIDGLLRRSKLAESAFLSVYKKLINMPDMTSVLLAVDKLQSEGEGLQECYAKSAEEMEEVMNVDNKDQYRNADNVSAKNLNLELSEIDPEEKRRETYDCAYSGCLSDKHRKDTVETMDSNELVMEKPNGSGLLQSSVVYQKTVDVGNRDLDRTRMSCSLQPAETFAAHLLKQESFADLQPIDDFQSNYDCLGVQEQEVKLVQERNDIPCHDNASGQHCRTMAGSHAYEVIQHDDESRITSSPDESVLISEVPNCLPVHAESVPAEEDTMSTPNQVVRQDTNGSNDEISDSCVSLNATCKLDKDLTQDIFKDQVMQITDPLPDSCMPPDGCSTVLGSTLPVCNFTNAERGTDLDANVKEGREHDQNCQDQAADRSEDQAADRSEDCLWKDAVRLENKKIAFQDPWRGKKESAKQSTGEIDLSVNNLSKMEDLASQIGHEIVTSFRSGSQYPQPCVWLPDGAIAKTEGFCFLPPAAHLHNTSSILPFTSNYHIERMDVVPNGLKAESADGLVPLDTMEVASRIREILSFHNLGQRLFARYVLGLSQGTVSELLSKPKPWEKLTEKGRESYRKMHHWASDERNIQMLKSLSSPKCNVTSSSSGHGDTVTEERIAQILSEAQAAMQLKQEAVIEKLQFHQSGLSAPRMLEPYSRTTACPSEQERSSRKAKTSRKGGSHASGSRNESSKSRKAHAESENLTREIVARIYQEELEKLAQVAEASGNVVELLTYRQELARLNQGWARRPGKPDAHKAVTEDKENHDEGTEKPAPKKLLNESIDRPGESKVEADQPQDLSISGSTEAHLSLPEAHCLPNFRVNASPAPMPVPVPTVGSSNGLLSPLQRMQSIANSLMLQTPSSSSQSLQPARTILPPISQEQFDMYASISTDELVKRVKDVLSQYSISQRLFGEYILGLSQGSVSDLLARPKPWHLLTQKGREPFIRMQMFVDDSESVQKLVASQYRVPTEKLLRSNSSSQLDVTLRGMVIDSSAEVTDSCDCPATTSRSSTPFRSPAAGHGDASLPRSSTLSSTVFSTVASSPSASDSMPVTFEKSLASGVSFPSMGVAMVPSVLSLFGATFLPSAQFGPLVNVDMHQLYGPGSTTASEVGTSSAGPELDTQAITARVKEVLQLNNLGQKLFGEAVLELSQGSVSELLSKPKPWHMLSLKGREPFVKMQMWLSDPLGVQKLHAYQTHMAGRRRKSGCEGPSSEKSGNQKKPRLFFSEEQKEALKAAYLRDPYPNQLAIEQLAGELDIGVKTVINWFHNHRMRAKQHQSCSSPTSTTAGSPSGSLLARIKSETPEDVMEFSKARWTPFAQEESSSASKTCRSKCDSATPTLELARIERNFSSVVDMKPGSALCLSDTTCTRNNNVESKRHELNKRKRARPHRLYDGDSVAGEFQATEDFRANVDMAIDLSINRVIDVHCDLAIPKGNHYDNETENRGEMLNDQGEDATMQKSEGMDVQNESNDNWCDTRRITNIEKLQQNLLLAPSDDWEF